MRVAPPSANNRPRKSRSPAPASANGLKPPPLPPPKPPPPKPPLPPPGKPPPPKPPARRKRDRKTVIAVPHEPAHVGPGGHVPQTHVAFVVPGGQRLAVGREHGIALDRLKHAHQLAAAHVPQVGGQRLPHRPAAR